MDPFDSSGNQSGAPPAGVRSAAANAAVLDIDNLPLEQLLQSEWFHQNISQMLNISVDNLTSLLINAQHQQQLQQQTAAAANSTGLGGLAGGNSSSSSVERDPLWLLATLTIFYALIFVAGVLGNLITCIVISRNKFMHTATNFYLFNLAVSDLILLLSGMPQELYNTWYPEEYPFTDLLCKMEGIFSETAANATVLTITAFTVERYIAICHPFRQHTMSKLSRAIKFIFAIWVTAFLLALPQAMQFSVVPQYSGLSCTMKNDFFEHVFAVSGFIFFGGPMTAICVLYVLIGVKLKRSRLLQAVPRRCYDVNRGISAQSRVIRMLVAVAVAFFLCWAPFHAQRLMAAYGSTAGVTSELFNRVYHILNYISGVLYFLSTCINPLLYNIMSHKFREAFKVTLARHFGLAGKYQTQSHNYSALLRQNGSMRLHTTDSIRTTTTTTTVNSASGGGGGGGPGCGGGGGGSASNSCRSSHRNRCISIGSQATLLTSLSKNDVFAAAPGPTQTQTQSQTPTPAQRSGAEHRLLQRQISQLSSVGDASSLFEADLGAHFHPHPHPHPQHHRAASRLKELRRSLASANGSAQAATGAGPGPEADCLSLDSQDWAAAGPGSGPERGADSETELVTKPVAPPLAPAAPPLVTPMHSIAELPSRSRLKLSRIISRRDEDAFAAQTSPRVELMRTHLPGMGHLGRPALLQPQPQPHPHPHLPKKPNLPTRTRPKTLESLAERFRWRARRPKAAAPESPAAAQPPAALMRVVYPATAASTETETELARTNGGGALFATSKAL